GPAGRRAGALPLHQRSDGVFVRDAARRRGLRRASLLSTYGAHPGGAGPCCDVPVLQRLSLLRGPEYRRIAAGEKQRGPDPAEAHGPVNLRERLGYVRAAAAVAPRRPTRPAAVLPPTVKVNETKFGDVFFAEQHWPLDHLHGGYPLGEALQVDEVALARLTESWTLDTVRDAVYLDIETSGLSGGTGTYAFLVGLGTFEGYSFRVRQYFLADPSGETAMLAAIAEMVDSHESLVTFNGRTFDVPQLATR